MTANTAILQEITNTRITQLQKQLDIRPGVSNQFDQMKLLLNQCCHNIADLTDDVHTSKPRALTAGRNASSAYSAPQPDISPCPHKNPYPGYGYKLPSVHSASELWYAWFGEGLFKDKPIQGGINQLIKDTKKDWRSDYEQSENRMFSRWKNIIQWMIEERGGRTLSIFLSEMDELYYQTKSKRVTPFHHLLKERDKKRRLNSIQDM